MKIEQKPSRLGDFAVLLTFGMFALCILLVLLGSARLYQNLTERDLRSYDARTVTQYLSTRLHQADRENALAVEDFEDTTALCIRETIGKREFITRIYCYDGYLRELFTPVTGKFSPEDGEKLLPAEDLAVSMTDNLLQLQVGQEQVLLYVRSLQGGEP